MSEVFSTVSSRHAVGGGSAAALSGGEPFVLEAGSPICDEFLSERDQPDAWPALPAAQVRLVEVNARARTTRRPQTRNHGSQR